MLKETIAFLRDHILECEPNSCCGRCDDLRKHIAILEEADKKLNGNIRESGISICECGTPHDFSLVIDGSNFCSNCKKEY